MTSAILGPGMVKGWSADKVRMLVLKNDTPGPAQYRLETPDGTWESHEIAPWAQHRHAVDFRTVAICNIGTGVLIMQWTGHDVADESWYFDSSEEGDEGQEAPNEVAERFPFNAG